MQAARTAFKRPGGKKAQTLEEAQERLQALENQRREIEAMMGATP
jgi:hypothetical protein